MRRQHLRMRIHIHTCTLGLFQQLFQILQIMTRNQNARICSDPDINRSDFRISVGACISLVQQSHTLDTILTSFQCQCRQGIHVHVVIQQLGQIFLQKGINFFILITKGIGMFHIGSQTLETIGNQLAQRANILISGGQNTNLARMRLSIKRCLIPVPYGRVMQTLLAVKLAKQLLLDSQSPHNSVNDGILIKIGVGNRRKQIDSHQMIHIPANSLAFLAQPCCDLGQSLACIDQQILHRCYIRLLAADSGIHTSLAASSLLALITKHLCVHSILLLHLLLQS